MTDLEPSPRVERALGAALDPLSSSTSPPRLLAAIRHAVFPGGARMRPRLCLAVARACGEDEPALAETVAASVELLHCASLVHDDLPCFDAAATRRGRPSVHRAFGQPLAVLAGDQLIVLAFESVACLARRAGSPSLPARALRAVELLARGVGTPHGLVAGQAWESEPEIPAVVYRRAKTASLFEAAAALGAVAAGADEAPWRVVGQRLGEAYQVADDILDVAGDEGSVGKPVGRDAALGRPNVARELGVDGAARLFERLVLEGLEAIPRVPGGADVRAWVLSVADRLRLTRRPSQLDASLSEV